MTHFLSLKHVAFLKESWPSLEGAFRNTANCRKSALRFCPDVGEVVVFNQRCEERAWRCWKALLNRWNIEPPLEYLLGRGKIPESKNTVFLLLNCTHLGCYCILHDLMMLLVHPMVRRDAGDEAVCNCKESHLHLVSKGFLTYSPEAFHLASVSTSSFSFHQRTCRLFFLLVF